jgi:hypothetical protein
MIYGASRSITKKLMELDGADHEKYIEKEIFNGLTNELHKNLSNNIVIREDLLRGINTHEIRIVAFSKHQFDKKMERLLEELNDLHLSPEIQRRILNIFIQNPKEEYKAEKTYI